MGKELVIVAAEMIITAPTDVEIVAAAGDTVVLTLGLRLLKIQISSPFLGQVCTLAYDCASLT